MPISNFKLKIPRFMGLMRILSLKFGQCGQLGRRFVDRGRGALAFPHAAVPGPAQDRSPGAPAPRAQTNQCFAPEAPTPDSTTGRWLPLRCRRPVHAPGRPTLPPRLPQCHPSADQPPPPLRFYSSPAPRHSVPSVSAVVEQKSANQHRLTTWS